MSPTFQTPWDIHEAIRENIRKNSPGMVPDQIEIPPGNKWLPPGIYRQNADGMWVEAAGQ